MASVSLSGQTVPNTKVSGQRTEPMGQVDTQTFTEKHTQANGLMTDFQAQKILKTIACQTILTLIESNKVPITSYFSKGTNYGCDP